MLPKKPESFKKLRSLDPTEFYFAKVQKVVTVKGKPKVVLTFGLPTGEIPYDSLVRYAKLLDLAQPKGLKTRMRELTGSIKPGDILFVEVRSYDQETHHAVVELHKRPVINGAIVALDKGEVRAVVSGFDPQGYNRAIFGKRQPGSVFKAVSYFAALQLGWSMLDPLENERRLFPYQGQFYYPQPDHASPYKKVSMLWSGVKSENLAAIYLTSNLIEKLNFEQFKGIMKLMNLLPNDGESKRDFHFRVGRKVGVSIHNDGVKEYELGNAIRDIAPDLVFSGEHELLNKLKKMWWGAGYAAEIQRLYQLDPEEYSVREKTLRIDLVKNNFQRHGLLAANLRNDWEFITSKVDEMGADAAASDTQFKEVASRFRVVGNRGRKPALAYFRVFPDEEVKPNQDPTQPLFQLESDPGRSLNVLDVRAIWGESGMFSSRAEISLQDVRLDGYLPYKILRDLKSRVEERYDAVLNLQSPYDLYRYYHHHDFRIALGLRYLKMLCEEMGVFSQIEPVLSFPLGTNVVSVAEVAKVYQTFIDGKTYRFYKDGPSNQINLIKRIEDRSGNVLFEPMREERELVRHEFALQMREILRKVVTHGTGRRAKTEYHLDLKLDENSDKTIPIQLPAFGKTGTTNDYRTASFAGFVPYPVTEKAPLDPSNSYVLASYVGYDFNREMRRGGFKVSGGYGALPVWTDLAKDIAETKEYESFLDRLDLKIISRQSWPLKRPSQSRGMRVDLPRGVVLNADESEDKEKVAITNYSVTGEEFVNEFALTSSVKSLVRVPIEPGRSGLLSPLRMVSPFVAYVDPEEEAPEDDVLSIPTKVETDAARRMPGEQPEASDRRSDPSGLSYRDPDRRRRPRDPARTRPNVEGDSSDQNGTRSRQDDSKVPETIIPEQDEQVREQEDDDPSFQEEELW